MKKNKIRKINKRHLKYIAIVPVILVFFYFFSFQSLSFFFNYYRAINYGVIVPGTIDSIPCKWQSSPEYSGEEFCDIYYSFKYNNKGYQNRIHFIESSKCENISAAETRSIAFMKSHPEKSYIIRFYEYSRFWAITNFIISIIALPLCLLFLYSFIFEKEKKESKELNT